MTTRRAILEEAITAVCTDRNAQYGEPEDNFAIVSGLWREAFGWEVTPAKVGLALSLLKVARIVSGQPKADSYTDACGYLACAAQCALPKKSITPETPEESP